MSFQFRFQRVLDVREQQEDLEEIEFARVQNRLRSERETLEELEQKLEDHYQNMRNSRKMGGSASSFSQQQEYTQYLLGQIERQKEVVEDWERKLEKQREQLIEASQRREVLETLKENDHEEFQKEVLRSERRELNQVAARQYARDEDDNG